MPDKCGGAEHAGPQDLGEKTNYMKSFGKVFSGRVRGSDSSYLRLVETCIRVSDADRTGEKKNVSEMLRRWNWLDFLEV